jgi:hypothetical protein
VGAKGFIDDIYCNSQDQCGGLNREDKILIAGNPWSKIKIAFFRISPQQFGIK